MLFPGYVQRKLDDLKKVRMKRQICQFTTVHRCMSFSHDIRYRYKVCSWYLVVSSVQRIEKKDAPWLAREGEVWDVFCGFISLIITLAFTPCILFDITLLWRHNGRYGVSNQQPHDCLLNLLFRCRSKKASKFRVTGLCAWNSPGPVNSPHKWPVTRKMFPFDDVIMIMYSTAM